MHITAKGWGREHLTHKVGNLNLDEAKWEHFGTRYITGTYGYQVDDGVLIKFGGNQHMQGNFDFTMHVSREDAARLFAKAFEGVPVEDALAALLPHFRKDERKKAA